MRVERHDSDLMCFLLLLLLNWIIGLKIIKSQSLFDMDTI